MKPKNILFEFKLEGDVKVGDSVDVDNFFKFISDVLRERLIKEISGFKAIEVGLIASSTHIADKSGAIKEIR